MASNRMDGCAPGWGAPYAKAVAPTASDTADEPEGVCQAIMVGANGNVKVTLEGGSVITLAMTAGYANRQTWAIRRVWSTDTTATGMLLLYV